MKELQSESRVCHIIRAEMIDYIEAWEWQRQLAAQRSAGAIGDTLLLLQHPHTYTLGRATKAGHLLVEAEALATQGVALVESDRGGDITYHGPGQVVGYPILKLSRHGGDVLRYLRMLEETIIVALAGYGITAERAAGLTGVWAGSAKIAAIGVKLSASGVTQHGFALNVATDLRYFQQIIPCGIAGRSVISLAQLLGAAPPQAEVEQRIIAAFGQVFEVEPILDALVEVVSCGFRGDRVY
jgi:lipoyl(octanoyl) transferase